MIMDIGLAAWKDTHGERGLQTCPSLGVRDALVQEAGRVQGMESVEDNQPWLRWPGTFGDSLELRTAEICRSRCRILPSPYFIERRRT